MKRGIYIAPSEIINSVNYVHKLIDNEFKIFLLRTGFNPLYFDPIISQAIEIVKKSDAEIWLLVGTWWGDNFSPDSDIMKLPKDLEYLNAKGFFGNYSAHESQWKMLAPGNYSDTLITDNINEKINLWNPHAICLTHARFRHPAYIQGLFEITETWINSISGTSWKKIIHKLKNLSSHELLYLSKNNNLITFFDLLHDSDIFSQWFLFRNNQITLSLKKILKGIKEVNQTLLVGTNAIGPHTSNLSGQNYQELIKIFDFIQPLFGYIEWHIFQCICAWGNFLQATTQLSNEICYQIAWQLFEFAPDLTSNTPLFPLNENLMQSEGDEEIIKSLVHQSLNHPQIREIQSNLIPVIRGSEWSKDTVISIEKGLKKAGHKIIFFQGTQSILN